MSLAVSSSPVVWHMAMSPAATTTGSAPGAGGSVVCATAPGSPRVTSGGTTRTAGSHRHRRTTAGPRFTEATLLTLATKRSALSAPAGSAPVDVVEEPADQADERLGVVPGGEMARAADPGEAG